MNEGTANQSMTIKNDIVSFVEIHKVHSANQKYYILNVVDLLKEYDNKVVEIITKKATRKIWFSCLCKNANLHIDILSTA